MSQRTREIGIRIALGAQQNNIGQMVIKEGTVIALVGLSVGLAVSAVLMRVLRTLLYGVSPFDGPAFLSVAIVLFVTAILASCIPAYRAARVDPVLVLREE